MVKTAEWLIGIPLTALYGKEKQCKPLKRFQFYVDIFWDETTAVAHNIPNVGLIKAVFVSLLVSMKSTHTGLRVANK